MESKFTVHAKLDYNDYLKAHFVFARPKGGCWWAMYATIALLCIGKIAIAVIDIENLLDLNREFELFLPVFLLSIFLFVFFYSSQAGH